MLHAAWSGTGATLDAAKDALVALLQAAVAAEPGHANWGVALGVTLLRVSRRIDAIVATDRAVLAIQFRPEARAFTAADRRAAEDAALDLADFHAGSRAMPILPIVLIPNGAQPRSQFPLPIAGAAPVVEASRLTLPLLLRAMRSFPPLDCDGIAWLAAPYTPVSGLMEAACLLYAQHGVASLRLASTGPDALGRTRAAVEHAVAQAFAHGERRLIIVTGAPGAGKTLVGLDCAFGPGRAAAFLTGNPTLVHVLREALVRDAAARGLDRRAARRRVEAVIQSLPQVRDALVATGVAPPEALLVVDEAQRCWSHDHAIGRSRNRPVRLPGSEPAILLDALSRRPGAAVIVALVGRGQEIHDGEAGLGGWGAAVAARPEWRVSAPPGGLGHDPRHALPALPGVEIDPALHLGEPIRAVHRPAAIEWVEAVLANAPERAAAIAGAASGVPFAITRSLRDMRAALHPRGWRSAGLLASAHAARLRAEGLGARLPHQDDDAVARWFLDRWPDVRSSDALEVVASEFAVQGLELDRAGLCWDADLIREGGAWCARNFRASGWTRAGPDAAANRVNAYRVLLTRARHGTVIWVPRGASRDPTRDPGIYEGIAGYLLACGASLLDVARARDEDDAACPEPVLL